MTTEPASETAETITPAQRLALALGTADADVHSPAASDDVRGEDAEGDA